MNHPPSDSYFGRLQRREASPPPVSTTLGGVIRGFDAGVGTLQSDYLATPAFLNPAGQVQGGILGAMLDDVTAFLVTATLQPCESCATLSLNLSFVRPAFPGPLTGDARLVRRGRNVCHVDAELRQAGATVATATAVCLIVPDARREPGPLPTQGNLLSAHPSAMKA